MKQIEHRTEFVDRLEEELDFTIEWASFDDDYTTLITILDLCLFYHLLEDKLTPDILAFIDFLLLELR